MLLKGRRTLFMSLRCTWWMLLMLLMTRDVVVAFCPAGCLCDDETLQVTCDTVNLQVIPITLNPSVQRLMLGSNKIRSIDTGLRFYTELTFADFSNNKLVSIQNHSFEGQKKLGELRLDHNKISSITNNTWKGLHSLSILTLRDNFLQSIEAKTFSTVPGLRDIDLGQNRIEIIHPAAFEGLPNLRTLYLDDNRLSINQVFFPDFLFPLRTLAELSLAKNSFEILPDDIFSSVPGLSILDLSGSMIKNISDNAFRNLTGLRSLRLHDNSITEVPSRSWHAIPHLEHLTLGQNPIGVVRHKAFSGLAKIQILEVHGAALLVEIESSALETNQDLLALRITNSKKLTELPEGLLKQLPVLSELNLKDNSLTDVPQELVDWSQLNRLDLSGNPLSCSCGLKWLRDLLHQRKPRVRNRKTRQAPVESGAAGRVLLVSEPVCGSPLAVSNLPLRSLSDEQLGCFYFSASQGLIVSVAGGCAVFLVLVSATLWRCRRRLARVCDGDKKTPSETHLDKRHHPGFWRPSSPVWGTPTNSVSLIGHSTNSVSLIGHQQPIEFQKTCQPEEECFMRAVSLHSSLRTFPRTEL